MRTPSETGTRPIRVLIADDSLVAREMLSQILASDAGIEVIGLASNGVEAVEMVARLRPDLVTMDVHMPTMDGLEATEHIMAYTPTPILVVSSSVHGEGMGRAFDALAIGALEVIKKPEPRDWAELEGIGREIIRTVKILSRVRAITHIGGRRAHAWSATPPPESARRTRGVNGIGLVVVGSSTGGPSALMSVLGGLPADFPVPIVVAQHIAEGFVPGLARWLDAGCAITVSVAEDCVELAPGTAYIAATGSNTEVAGDRLRLVPARAGQLYVPSADALFESAGIAYGAGAIGVLLTGMGADGARGLKRLADLGAPTICQDEASSTVWGMPKAAIDLGAARQVLATDDIAGEIARLVARV